MQQPPSNLNEALVRVVRGRLAEAGLTLRATAELIGISHPTLSRRLKASSPYPLTVGEVAAIAQAVGVNASDLVALAESRLRSAA